jgi:hypothetical protein
MATAPQTTPPEPEFHEHVEARDLGWGTFWWILSVLVHAAAIFAVIWFTPVRKWFFEDDGREAFSQIQPESVRRIVEQMLRADRLRAMDRIRDQQRVARELERYRQRSYQRYTRMLEFSGSERKPETLASLGSPGPAVEVPLTDRSLAELYGIARNIEIASHGLYRQIRTLELARIQDITLSAAAGVTHVAVPDRPSADAALLSEVIYSLNDGRIDALKSELGKIRSQIESMLAAGQRMLDAVRGIIGDDIGATDLGLAGGGVSGGSSLDSFLGSMRPEEYWAGDSDPDPGAYEHEWGRGVGPVTHRDGLFAREKSADFGRTKPTRGRKLVSNAPEKAEWMYIESWFIIGPFPNPGRSNLDVALPPESSLDKGIDLDAVYVGQGGKPVQWQFRMSVTLPVVPHVTRDEAIWYAFSEVYAEEDHDRWCIFGSDDFGKAWVNGEMVFASGKTPHPWIPDRAYKKVHFKKGFNPVLFKLENAWGRTGFSMCLYLGES